MNRWWIAAWITGILTIVASYIFIVRDTIVLAYQDVAPVWFENLVNNFYPRFTVERHRFDMEFFLRKADQVMIRLSLVNALLVGLFLYYKQSEGFAHSLHKFWQKSVTIRQVNWVSVLFYSGMILFSYGYYGYLNDLAKVAVFYKPILILRLLHIPFPSSIIILILYILLITTCIAVIIRLKPVASSWIALIVFLLFQGWLYSFEKIDHTFATFNYAAMIMPFLLYERERALKKKLPLQAGWPLQLICLCIGLVYLMSGLEKVLTSGIYWISADSFRSYIFLHQAPLGMWIAQHEWLSRLLPAMALLFQLGFITILFYPKLKPVILLTGIAFHIGTYLLFGVGWYIGPWVFVYLFFIEWDKFSATLNLAVFNNKPRSQEKHRPG